MSWYGMHPKGKSKAEVTKEYPYKCKWCRYFYRVFDRWYVCSRCGNNPDQRICRKQ